MHESSLRYTAVFDQLIFSVGPKMHFYSIRENKMTSRSIDENCLWDVSQDGQNLVFIYKGSKTVEIRTISEFISITHVSLGHLQEPVDPSLW